MKNRTLELALSLAFFSVFSSSAFAAVETKPVNDLSVFKSVYEIETPVIKLPTAMKVSLPAYQNFGVAIIEVKSEAAQPVRTIKNKMTDPSVVTVEEISPVRGNKNYFADGDMTTVGEFNIDSDFGQAYINLKYSKPIKSSSLYLNLDNHVALPYSVAINARVDGKWVTALAKTYVSNSYITFPQRTSDEWRVELSHSQPLKIREMSLVDDNYVEAAGEDVVWLARPGETYKIYTDAAAYTPIRTGESGDLLENKDEIVVATLGQKQTNSTFKEPDDDDDGIPNYRDNCVGLSNPKQEDLDNNKKGDACEDHDRDGVMDSRDNCPEDPNGSQVDTDGDKIGDACDEEESRVTENLPWLPWAGMGFAALVVFGIVVQSLRKDKKFI